MKTQLVKPKKKPARKHSSNGRNHASRVADIVINGSVHIPPWVTDHDSFRRWACSDDLPQRGQYFYLDGELWVDLSMETLIHNQIKGIFAIVIGSIVLHNLLGKYLGDRMLLTNTAAGLSCEPDGMFIANATFDDGAVTLEEGDDSLEVLGTPDVTLEVISKSSIEKDAVILKDLYAKAGIPEYWLVDSTTEKPELVIFRLVNGKYKPVRKFNGWVKSNVLGFFLRLTCLKDADGTSRFNLKTNKYSPKA